MFKRCLLVSLLLCSPVYAAKKAPRPAHPPEAKEECVKSDAIEKVLAERVSDRKDFDGDALEKLRASLKASKDVPDLPDTTDHVQLYRSGSVNYIIILFHKECVQIAAKIPVKIFDKVLNEDGSI